MGDGDDSCDHSSSDKVASDKKGVKTSVFFYYFLFTIIHWFCSLFIMTSVSDNGDTSNKSQDQPFLNLGLNHQPLTGRNKLNK